MRTVTLRGSHLLFFASLVTASGFFGGALSGRIFAPREALAQSRPLTTTINVGPQGLLFRDPDGRVIARLASDPMQGGIFELYNANEQPGARLRASAMMGTLDVLPSSSPIPPPTVPAITRSGASSAIGRDLGF